MVKVVSAAHKAALESRHLDFREFLWIEARNRATGAIEGEGAWSGTGPFDAQLYNPDTDNIETRPFTGVGTMIPISAVRRSTGLVAQDLTFELAHEDPVTLRIVRTHTVKYARVELYRGAFYQGTRRQAGPAEPRFLGFINDVEISTPPRGELGLTRFMCKSHIAELDRVNPDTRSDASQRQRDENDAFFLGCANAHEVEIFWGMKRGKPDKE